MISNNDFLSDKDLITFVSQQLELLIMRVSNSAQLMNIQSLEMLLKLYSNIFINNNISSPSSSSHIIRDRLQYICLNVLQKEKKPLSSKLMKLLESARLNTELFIKIDVMNAADHGNSEYIEEKILSQQQQQQLWMKKELLTSFANKGDVNSVLSAFESVNKLLSESTLIDGENIKKQHQIFLKESIKKFLENCNDINMAFVMMDKLLRSPISQKFVNFGHFLTMIDIGIENKSEKSQWFQIKHLLQLLLNIPYKTINDIIIYDKLIKYCLIHNDIVGLSDALQMLFDCHNDIKNKQKISQKLFEQIMEFISNKSSDAALHLFQKLSNYSEKPTFKCLYWVLKACGDIGDEIGLQTVKDLMITNNINQNQWDINIYNSIIECNSFKGKLKIKQSLNLFQKLLSNNLLPNIETFNALLSHHKHSNHDDDDDDVDDDDDDDLMLNFILNQIDQIKFYNLEPSQDTFSIILEYCAKHKNKEIGNQLLNMIHELPSKQQSKIINDEYVWLYYLQCFDSYKQLFNQLTFIFKSFKGGIGGNLLTNNIFKHLVNVVYNNHNNDESHDISNIVLAMRNMETLIDLIIDNNDNNNNDTMMIKLEMTGYCKVFDVIYMINKSYIDENNIESWIYSLNQIEIIFWRFLEKMKDINIFFPDPDLLKPYLYLKDIELECYQLSSSSKMINIKNKYDNINDGLFQFIQYGVFVSPQLIIDLCHNLSINENTTNNILTQYKQRRKYEQNVRQQQSLPFVA